MTTNPPPLEALREKFMQKFAFGTTEKDIFIPNREYEEMFNWFSTHITLERERIMNELLERAKGKSDMASNYIDDIRVIEMVRLSEIIYDIKSSLTPKQ